MKDDRPVKGGFTLIELLVVIAIIAILAALLLPALSRAKTKAKAIACINNNREIAIAFMMHASDNGEQLPPLNTGTWPAVTTNWWFSELDKGQYITSSTVSNKVWHCPAVKKADISFAVTLYFKSPCEGYGPEEGATITTGVIRYAKNTDGTPLGSLKLTQIKRPAQIWLIGDVGVPKSGQTIDKLPVAGYYTEITTKQPTPSQGWTVSPYKQPACRHDSRAAFSFCDGHAESWRWPALRANTGDVFAIDSY
jgi:prepilin-type N-terminal cleavage/methylation domain-containing protein/prepilin-type processing-associated H-X9-DG protein